MIKHKVHRRHFITQQKYNTSGLLVLIDFDKAFGMVEWDFLF